MSHDNPFFFLRTFWASLRHADWDEAASRGPLALLAEFFRALMGLSAWPFFVPIESEWHPSTIRSILDAHGIESWGWGKHGGEFFFQVKLRQANWAQYLLLQRGVPISGQLLDEGARSAYRPGPRRSLRPVSGATPTVHHSVRNPITSTARGVTEPEAPRSLLRDPVGQVNRVVDHLAKW
jgi:hypothetical protein